LNCLAILLNNAIGLCAFLLARPRAVQRLLADLGRRAGVEVTPHTLRHAFAKNLINAGVTMEKG